MSSNMLTTPPPLLSVLGAAQLGIGPRPPHLPFPVPSTQLIQGWVLRPRGLGQRWEHSLSPNAAFLVLLPLPSPAPGQIPIFPTSKRVVFSIRTDSGPGLGRYALMPPSCVSRADLACRAAHQHLLAISTLTPLSSELMPGTLPPHLSHVSHGCFTLPIAQVKGRGCPDCLFPSDLPSLRQ